jgi:hypothetical protein
MAWCRLVWVGDKVLQELSKGFKLFAILLQILIFSLALVIILAHATKVDFHIRIFIG